MGPLAKEALKLFYKKFGKRIVNTLAESKWIADKIKELSKITQKTAAKVRKDLKNLGVGTKDRPYPGFKPTIVPKTKIAPKTKPDKALEFKDVEEVIVGPGAKIIYGKFPKKPPGKAEGGIASFANGELVLPRRKPEELSLHQEKKRIDRDRKKIIESQDALTDKGAAILELLDEDEMFWRRGMKDWIEKNKVPYEDAGIAGAGGLGDLLGERVNFAEGDTPSQAWMRDYFYKSGLDRAGVITLREYMDGGRGWRDYADHGPGKAQGGRIGYRSGTAYPDPNRVAPSGDLATNMMNVFANKFAGRKIASPGSPVAKSNSFMGSLLPNLAGAHFASLQSSESQLQQAYESYVASGGGLGYEEWKTTRTSVAQGGRIGYGAGDFVKKITKRFSEDRTKEDIGKWLKEKDVDLTVEEWRSKPLKEKLKLWAWKFQPFYTGDLEKGKDYESGGRVGFRAAGLATLPYLSRGWSQPGVYKAPRGFHHMEEILAGGAFGIGASKFLKDKDKPVTKKTKESKTPETTPPKGGPGFEIVTEIVVTKYLEDLDKRIMDEMELTKSEMDNMSSTALDDLRRNADPQGMHKHFDEITPGRGVGDFADDPDFLKDDYTSGGIETLKDVTPKPDKLPAPQKRLEDLVDVEKIEYKIVDGRMKETSTWKTYKRSDKNRPPTEDEIEDYMEILPHGGEMDWHDFGSTIEELDAALEEQRAYERQMMDEYKTGKLDKYMSMDAKLERVLDADNADRPSGYDPDEEEEIRAYGDEKDRIEIAKMNEAEELAKAKASGSPWFTDPKTLSPEEELRKEFPGIDDKMIKNILTDTDPQRLADVKQILTEALDLGEKGKDVEGIIKILKDKMKKASGGRIGLEGGGPAYEDFEEFMEDMKGMNKQQSREEFLKSWEKYKKWKYGDKLSGGYLRREEVAGGGRLTRTIPPERGPVPQGLSYLLYDDTMRTGSK